MKDHEIAALVNALRDIAIKYHGAQQLRERIAALVVSALRGKRSPEMASAYRRFIVALDCVIDQAPIGHDSAFLRTLVELRSLLQQSSSGITADAEKPTQVVDSGAAGPTRTGDLLITNQGAETAETLGNQQDTPTPAPAEGAKVAQGESITCEGVTAGLRPPADRIRHVLNFAATHALAALAELEADAEIGRDWRADSSLAKWFPSTAREMDELRANLAEYEQAPTVAVVEGKYGLNLAYRYPFSDKPPPIGTELIARPTRKDGAP